ncbi:hypothetical protein Tco_0257701 [Tanacetum coccineum]
MHTRASNSELVEPLPEPKRTLNRRLRRRNKRVPYDQRNNPPQHPRIVYPPILNINYFRHFLDILRNYNPINDEPMLAADRVVAWKRISKKKTKNKAKNDNTEHGMEKRRKVKSQSQPEKSTVKTGGDTEEYLMGPPEPI